MKVIMIWLVCLVFSFANVLEVRDDNVTISINGVKKTLAKGYKDENLQAGSSVCFISGEGVVKLDDILIDKSDTNCYQAAIKETSVMKKIIAYFQNKYTILISNSKEHTQIAEAVGVKSVKSTTAKEEELNISKNQKDIIISGKYYPFPIILSIKNENGEVVKSMTNSKSDISFFVIDREYLKEGFKIELIGGKFTKKEYLKLKIKIAN